MMPEVFFMFDTNLRRASQTLGHNRKELA